MPKIINRYGARQILALLAGASTSFAFAPYALWPLAILSLALLIVLIQQQNTKQAFLLGWLWGLGLFGLGLSWVHVTIDTFGGVPPMVTVLLLFLLSSYLALFPAIFSALVSRFSKHQSTMQLIAITPFLWMATEWLRGWLFTGFPWLWLGYSQIDSPLASFAPIGGVETLNGVVALLAALFAALWISRKIVLIVPLCAVFVAGYLLNNIHWVTPQTDSPTKLALIQGNIAQEKKWLPSERWPTLEKYARLTGENFDADIIIWPEAAVPAFEYELPQFFSIMDREARAHHAALITGVLNQVDRTTFYNSILVLGENGKDGYQQDIDSLYHKSHLLPFGEFVPFEEWLRPLAPIFNLPNSAFSRGDYIQDNVLANQRHLVAAICYEIVFGKQVRDNLTEDTDFILTLSNDAWFGTSVGPLQHMEIARMRALETGKPVIRATNNGVTAVTDEQGTITAQIPQFETAVLRATVYPTQGKTPYAQWGSWPMYILSLLALLLSRRRKTNKLRAEKTKA